MTNRCRHGVRANLGAQSAADPRCLLVASRAGVANRVMPDPQRSSCGSICHGIPLRSTNRMPVRHATIERSVADTVINEGSSQLSHLYPRRPADLARSLQSIPANQAYRSKPRRDISATVSILSTAKSDSQVLIGEQRLDDDFTTRDLASPSGTRLPRRLPIAAMWTKRCGNR